MQVKILTASEGKCLASVVIQQEHCNIGGVMHGSFASSLIDCISTMALLTYDDQKPGVSVDLNVSLVYGQSQLADFYENDVYTLSLCYLYIVN